MKAAVVWRKGELDIMTLILKPLHPVFVAEATGLDRTKRISREDACEINAAMNRYGVPVWRGRPLTAQQQIGFATAFEGGSRSFGAGDPDRGNNDRGRTRGRICRH